MHCGTISDDLIELHIVGTLNKLVKQNKRYKDIISATKDSTQYKKVSSWKAYDFYNYFCTKYKDKYDDEFELHGNIEVAYKRIEQFLLEYEISNTEYKKFIDLAFSRYFNKFITPKIGNLCSIDLLSKLLNTKPPKQTTNDLLELDHKIMKESDEFEEDLRDSDVYYDYHGS